LQVKMMKIARRGKELERKLDAELTKLRSNSGQCKTLGGNIVRYTHGMDRGYV